MTLIDKIRAEILKEKECAYADFERYKVEYLRQDWDDVKYSTPLDDFRYGMERCIDILDKYKAENRNDIDETNKREVDKIIGVIDMLTLSITNYLKSDEFTFYDYQRLEARIRLLTNTFND